METSHTDQLGSVLVVGGCGFVGSHIVQLFLSEPGCSSVSVISRNPQSNRFPRANYQAGDITDLASLRVLLSQIRPSIIIHAACPSATSANAKAYENVTVRGTQNLLTAASEASVKAFIFTSSSTMAAGPEHIDLDESAPLADTTSNSHPYARTKAIADKMVLKANRPGKEDKSHLLTACIRLPIVYGERDLLSIPGSLAALEKGQTNFQLGDGSNLWDFSSAENAATAHLLLCRALLAQYSASPNRALPKVDGEAFNITDGQRRLFWDYPRTIWKATGHEIDADKIWIMPTWLALAVAGMMEWLFKLFTFGTKRPSLLGKQQVEYSCFTHTYSIKKAQERLGYKPVQDFDGGIRKSVEWLLNEGGWSSRLKKVH